MKKALFIGFMLLVVSCAPSVVSDLNSQTPTARIQPSATQPIKEPRPPTTTSAAKKIPLPTVTGTGCITLIEPADKAAF